MTENTQQMEFYQADKLKTGNSKILTYRDHMQT
jgi:hypothetical protein